MPAYTFYCQETLLQAVKARAFEQSTSKVVQMALTFYLHRTEEDAAMSPENLKALGESFDRSLKES